MKKLYLLTGVTGHLGTALLSKIMLTKADIRALVLPKEVNMLHDQDIQVYPGDISKASDLTDFFNTEGYDQTTLIHCAAMISIATEYDPILWQVNVTGTKNVLNAALENKVDRVIYVSSVDALSPDPKGGVIKEMESFQPDEVTGQYSKSKATAGNMALEFAQKGLNVSIVHPSTLIGPGDKLGKNHMVNTMKDMRAGKIAVSIDGGSDLVDVRDVAEGIMLCEAKGRSGQSYILSGEYITIKDLLNMIRSFDGKKPINFKVPHFLIKALVPVIEWVTLKFTKKKPVFTPFSIEVLKAEKHYSHEKASQELGYAPRPLAEAVRESL